MPHKKVRMSNPFRDNEMLPYIMSCIELSLDMSVSISNMRMLGFVVAEWEILVCRLTAKALMRNLFKCKIIALGRVQAMGVFQHTNQAWVVNPMEANPLGIDRFLIPNITAL